MRITESQLRKIVREEMGRISESVGISPGPINTPAQFKMLQAGDRITIDGRPSTVISFSDTTATLVYANEGSSTKKYLDARYAYAWEPGETPERIVTFVGSGDPVKSPRRAPRRRTSYSYYD